jgi:hypothetical protein
MDRILALLPILIGALLLLYIFTVGGITNYHYVQQYVLLSAGVVCVAIGFAALAVIWRR